MFKPSQYSFFNHRFNKYYHTENKHGAPLHYFAYMKKGKSKIVSESKTILVNSGDIFYIPKDLKYRSYWYGNNEILFLSLGCADLMAKDSRNLELQVVDCPEELKRRFSEIPPVGNDVSTQIIGEFFSTIALLLPYMSKTPVSNTEKILIDAKNYLKTNPICFNGQVAKSCNISLPYLYKIFSDNQGESPNEYRKRILCYQAIELLITTDKSVEEICSELNFCSSNYFRIIFKKYIGTTPREIRRQYGY